MTFCIAAPDFGRVSETFIREHVRSIAPDLTVLLCLSADTDDFGCPLLSNIDPWPPPQSPKQQIIDSIRFRWRRFVNPSLSSADRRRVRAFLKAYQTTAVLAEYGPVGCLLARTCSEADVPLYVHFHGYDASILLRDRWQTRHYKAMFSSSAGIIVPSHFLAGKLASIGCPKHKLHVSACGVDALTFTPRHRLPQRVVAVGRLVEKKAPHLTIKAFYQVRKNFPRARLDIIGDGPLADTCRRLVGDLSLGDGVQMHGERDHEFVARTLGEASLFVQHSVSAQDGDSEGLPVAVLEAMAAALPVVSTRHSGIPEAVEDGVTGLLVGEWDVDGMAAAMAKLLGDPGQAMAMGEAGRVRVLANFTREKARDRLRAIMSLPVLAPPE